MSNAWYGCRRDIKDARDFIYKPRAVKLPAVVDLRSACPPVMDQGELGSCTAHGITGALRYEIIKNGGKDVELSRLQLYFDERDMEGTITSDAGAEIRDGIKCASKLGVGHENLWPYNVAHFDQKPPAKCYKDAVNFRALKYQRVPVNVTALKSALASGHPVVIGVTLYDSFESAKVAKNGLVPIPKKGEGIVGGHCLYVVGYGQHTGYFTVRNSWASDWGDNGDCYFPETYLGNTKYGSDYWIITHEGK